MNTVPDAAASPRDHLARFALAQYLLFDAVVESLSTLGENVAKRRGRAGDEHEDEEFSASELTEPFRARYEYFRRVR